MPAATAAKSPKGYRWLGPALFGAALAVRLISLAEFSVSPLADFPSPDAEYYLQAGADLRRDGLLSGGVFAMNPLYTVLVGWMTPLVGVFGIRLLQCLVGALTSWMIFRIGSRVFGSKAGLAAGLAHALYPMAILFSLTLLPVTIATAGCAAAVLLALKTGSGERATPALAVGLLLGVSSLARPNLLLWAVAFMVWYWWDTPPARRRKSLALLILGLVIPVAAVTARNLAVSGQPVLIGSNGGINFYYGNHQGASGAFAIPPGFPDTPLEQFTAARTLAEAEAGRELDPLAVSRHWFGRGRDYLLGHPGQGLLLWARKAALLVNAREMPINEGLVEYGEFSRLLRIPLPWFGIMIPLGLAGLFLSAGRGDRSGKRLLVLVLAAHAAGILLFFVSSRHRFPVVVALLPFAGFALFELLDRLNGTDRRKLAHGGIILALAAALCWLPLVPRAEHYGHNRLGCLYLQADENENAEDQFRQALAMTSGYPDAHFNLGRVLTRTARHEEAIDQYRQTLEMEPGRRDAMLNLAHTLTQIGRPVEAEEQYLSLIWHHPEFASAHYNLALVRLRAGHAEEALAGFMEVIRLDPSFARAWLQSGVLLKNIPGQAEQAADHLRTYLRLDPDGRFADVARSELATLVPEP